MEKKKASEPRKDKGPSQPPDRQPLSESQAIRLARVADLEAKEVQGLTVVEVSEKFRWRIDPALLGFRRVCGRVVKKDPVTGVEHPVPYATVIVEDTDCSFLGIFPKDTKWAWLAPYGKCRREEIARARTDECGYFCVWIPRYDIDWVVRWRRERHCLPDLLVRPTLRDVLEEFPWPHPEPPVIRRPQPEPEPDPSPIEFLHDVFAFRRLQEVVGREAGLRIVGEASFAMLGGDRKRQRDLLRRPAFPDHLPPPAIMMDEIAETPHAEARAMKTAPMERDAAFPRDAELRYLGPFFRCTDVYVPTITRIEDVPDITFRVTQDIDGDGDEEVIYSEGYFDVRWDAGSIPPVTLYASQIAAHAITCRGRVPLGPCGEPAIDRLGYMPLPNPATGDPYHDPVTGYARRTNRPHASGLIAGPPTGLATAPFTGVVPVHGCNEMPGAQYYRVLASRDGGPWVPLMGAWWLFRTVSGMTELKHVVPDGAGWYDVIPDSEGWWPERLLQNWTTGESGLYRLRLQLGNGGKSEIHVTDPIGVRVDNTGATAQFTKLEWWEPGMPGWEDIGLVCPVVRRTPGTDIKFRVSYVASATHLLKMGISGGGCGGGGFVLDSETDTSGAVPASNVGQHWHRFHGDNTVIRKAIFTLPHLRPQGAYAFNLGVWSRAFVPTDAAGLTHNWDFTSAPVWTSGHLAVAVVNK